MDGKLADGLLLHASVITRELALLLIRMEIPHIIIGKPPFESSTCWIDNNNRLAGEIAASHLIENGHRKISAISGHEEDRITNDRLEGIKKRLIEEKLYDPANILRGESTIEDGEKMTRKLIKLAILPDAIICANNSLAFGCLRALQAQKIRVPKTVSLITFDDYPLAQLTKPSMTSVSIDMYDMGYQAGKLLLGKIKRPQMHIQTYNTVPQLVVRGSTMSRP
jgi:DNA-binding LacI/PurR family transcriptional regulator